MKNLSSDFRIFRYAMMPRLRVASCGVPPNNLVHNFSTGYGKVLLFVGFA